MVPLPLELQPERKRERPTLTPEAQPKRRGPTPQIKRANRAAQHDSPRNDFRRLARQDQYSRSFLMPGSGMG